MRRQNTTLENELSGVLRNCMNFLSEIVIFSTLEKGNKTTDINLHLYFVNLSRMYLQACWPDIWLLPLQNNNENRPFGNPSTETYGTKSTFFCVTTEDNLDFRNILRSISQMKKIRAFSSSFNWKITTQIINFFIVLLHF